jgi:flavin reductase (DIM6/NTAB) family NADH-FMN oxidoreductase RutF
MTNPTVTIDPSDLDPRDAYRLFISSVVPRPIAWVSTICRDGSLNLAPFSFFNGVGGQPPTIMFSVSLRAGSDKDTLRNVRDGREFVLHIVDERLAEKMNATSGEYSYGDSEFAHAGLTTAKSVIVAPPRVAEAAIAMECRVIQIVPVGNTGNTIVIGEIVLYHLRDGLLRNGYLVDATLLKPVARLGGEEYATLGRVFKMPRPSVAKAQGR